MNTTDLHAYWTVAMLILFVGIWIWAWSSKRKKEFNEAAMLPFADNDIAQRSGEPVEASHTEGDRS